MQSIGDLCSQDREWKFLTKKDEFMTEKEKEDRMTFFIGVVYDEKFGIDEHNDLQR